MQISDERIARAALAVLDQPVRDPTQGALFEFFFSPFGGRFFELDIVEREDRASEQVIVARRGNAELHVTLPHRFGDLGLAVPDRMRGVALAEQFALWLGAPLDDRPAVVLDTAPIRVQVPKVKLGSDRDLEGVNWVRYKLFLPWGDGPDLELFLQISSDGRARFSEKESRHRERLIELFETSFGMKRRISNRTRLWVGPNTGVAVPSEWSVADRGRHMRASDPTGRVELAVSCLGRGDRREKRIARKLRETLGVAWETSRSPRAAEGTSTSSGRISPAIQEIRLRGAGGGCSPRAAMPRCSRAVRGPAR